jgi:hypothetical protein
MCKLKNQKKLSSGYHVLDGFQKILDGMVQLKEGEVL